MNRRRIILILSLVLIIAIITAIYFALTSQKFPGGGTGSGTGSPISGSSSNLSGQNKTPVGADTNNVPLTETNVSALPRLRQITTVPTSGDTILTRQVDVIKDRVKTKETQYFVRYMDRATGHVFDIRTDSIAPLKISNTTIPKVYEAIFTPDGNSIITRLLSEVDNDQILTYFITLKDKLKTSTSTSENKTVAEAGIISKTGLKDVSGTYLPSDMKEIAMSPGGAKILSLYYTENGSKLTTSAPNGGGERTVLNHPLREWLLSFQGESRAVLTTKPSGITNGYAYLLDLATGGLSKIMGDIAGLTLLPNKDGNKYLGAGTPDGSMKLFVYSKSKNERVMLAISTLPEKCIWANTESAVAYCAVPQSLPNAIYPDSWYQGRISFTDNLWKINVDTGETTIISSLTRESGQIIDGINLKLADDDTYLTFINKADLTLWGLDLRLKASL